MKKTNILTGSLLAAAGLALVAPAARAATNSYNVGDLFIGFEQSGNASDYVIDIGPVSNYIGVTGSFNVSTLVGNSGASSIAADLASVYGSSWASNVQTNLLQWGVVGASSNSSSITLGADTLPKNTLFFTQGEVIVGSGQQSTTPTGSTNTVQGQVNNQILAFENNYSGSASTANSNYAEVQTVDAVNDPNSWTGHSPSGSAFGSGYSIEQPTTGSYTGPTDSALDLYEVKTGNGTAGTYLGKFTLDSSGDLTFTGATVPEPGSWGFLGLGTGLVILTRWRPATRRA